MKGCYYEARLWTHTQTSYFFLFFFSALSIAQETSNIHVFNMLSRVVWVWIAPRGPTILAELFVKKTDFESSPLPKIWRWWWVIVIKKLTGRNWEESTADYGALRLLRLLPLIDFDVLIASFASFLLLLLPQSFRLGLSASRMVQ